MLFFTTMGSKKYQFILKPIYCTVNGYFLIQWTHCGIIYPFTLNIYIIFVSISLSSKVTFLQVTLKIRYNLWKIATLAMIVSVMLVIKCWQNSRCAGN